MVGGLSWKLESKYCRSLDVAWISTTMDFLTKSWCPRRTVDCHLHHAGYLMIMTFVSFMMYVFITIEKIS